jgi:hypothetical protein
VAKFKGDPVVRLPTPAAPSIQADLECRCGYNLRGLSRDSGCPECGHPINQMAAYRRNRAVLRRRVVAAILLAFVIAVIIYLTAELKQELERRPPPGLGKTEWRQ